MSSSVFVPMNSADPINPPGSCRSYAMLPRSTCGYLKCGSVRSISFVKLPADAPVTTAEGAPGVNGIMFLLLFEAPTRVKSTPVLP